MAKRRRTPPTKPSRPAKPVSRQPRPGIVHTSLYLPDALYEGLREAAFKERSKIHDIVLEGIEMALHKRGMVESRRNASGSRRRYMTV